MTFSIGETVGAYQIVERLGQGGMATVYRAYHPRLDRTVAIKVLHPAFREDPNFLVRFQREAQIVARLEHPHIVPIYDYNEHNGQPYLVMKFIEGQTLKGRMSEKPLTLDETMLIMTTIGQALTFAHNAGVLHRDIKPSNILLEHGVDPFLADFGLARIVDAGESTLSQDMMLGTPQYISPEQAQGIRDLDAGTDIYSLGVVLYEILVGRVPFNADTPYAIVHDQIFAPLPLPSIVNPNIPQQVEQVLLKALAKNRTDRYASAVEMVEAFRQAVTDSHMSDANFSIGTYRAPKPTNGSATLPPGTPGVPATPTVSLGGGPQTPISTAPLPTMSIPSPTPSSVSAASLQAQSLTELRRRQQMRRRQSNLWIVSGFAGLVITVLAGLVIAVTSINDPAIRGQLFVPPALPTARPTPPVNPGLIQTETARAQVALESTSTAARSETPPPTTSTSAAVSTSTHLPTSTSAATSWPTITDNPSTTGAAVLGGSTGTPAATPTAIVIPQLSEAEAQALVDQDGSNPINWFALAVAQAKAKRTLRASGSFVKAVNLAGDNEPLLLGAAHAFMDIQETGYAIFLLGKTMSLSSTSPLDSAAAAHYLYVRAQSPTPSDLAAFKNLTQAFPNFGVPYAFYSIALANSNQLSDAVTALNQAERLMPGATETLFAEGILAEKQGQFDSARTAFLTVRNRANAPKWVMDEAALMLAGLEITATAYASLPTVTPMPTLTPTSA